MKPVRLLAIGTHPDDIEIGCGATISSRVRAGETAGFVIVTRGEQGWNKGTKNELAKIRQEEALCAAAELGVKDVVFLGLEDGLTTFTLKDKIKLIEILRACKPGTVFTHAKADLFPDHQVVHQLTMSAIMGASGPWYPEDNLRPHVVKKIFGYEVWNPINSPQFINGFVQEDMDIKVKSLSRHKSQVECIDYISAVQGLAIYRGAMCPSVDFKYAEAFEVLKLDHL